MTRTIGARRCCCLLRCHGLDLWRTMSASAVSWNTAAAATAFCIVLGPQVARGATVSSCRVAACVAGLNTRPCARYF